MDHEEPSLTTDPELEDIAAELRAREPLFTRPELGTDRETFEQMTSPEHHLAKGRGSLANRIPPGDDG
jgi:hypothetical protein